MKAVKFILLFLVFGCSSSKVVSDYDSNTTYSKYKTFNFYEDNGDNLNDFDITRITNYITLVLKDNFLEQDKLPDFFIYFDTQTATVRNNKSISIGLGNRNVGVSGGIPIGNHKINEKLIIKFIDADTNDLVWEGSLESKISKNRTPEQREAHLKEVISKILQKYPPKN
ncbi:DUF4136 domain-containing protein [Polaribacter sp. KT 15]|uniref:DUF4136 domain-containing protein n=1 Tax=Polaribacter sp. KT 15 TaxID=1896175 RepID=UPI00090AB086|nr:DUF4136 domain-containing protein [Polaribacter sp. KT 15]SHM78692.1 protein of unknown function [Polaribacter sp. KT 15]